MNEKTFDEHYSISPSHYNDIPDAILQGEKTILEFGPATGINHLISKHRRFFIDNNADGRYLGVEIIPYNEQYLNIIQGDMLEFKTDHKWDIIIALHVLEHVELRHWPRLLKRMKSWLSPYGHLIIGVPHNEPPGMSDLHLVSRITPDLIRNYLPDAKITKVNTKYDFAEDGARFAWALLRYIKRWLTRHPYIRRHARLLVIWRNKA